MSVSLLQLIETRLSGHSPGRKRFRQLMKRSAVAMVLQVREGELHILMIKRAEREGDPWSGHMAFPGGRQDAVDQTLEPEGEFGFHPLEVIRGATMHAAQSLQEPLGETVNFGTIRSACLSRSSAV